METIRKVRQAHFRDGKGIREIARDLNLARNTVKRIIRTSFCALAAGQSAAAVGVKEATEEG